MIDKLASFKRGPMKLEPDVTRWIVWEANLPPPKQRMIESVKAGYLMLLHFVQALIVLMTTWQTLSKICKKV